MKKAMLVRVNDLDIADQPERTLDLHGAGASPFDDLPTETNYGCAVWTDNFLASAIISMLGFCNTKFISSQNIGSRGIAICLTKWFAKVRVV